MIEINKDIIIQITTYIPFADSTEDLLLELYKLIPFIHKEPNCLDFELLREEGGTIIAIGTFKNSVAFNIHENLQYIEDFKRKKLPVYCERFESKVLKKVIPPLTALSLLNE